MFISNLVNNKLDIIGNVTESEGITESFFREVKKMLNNFLKDLKKRGVTPKEQYYY